MHVWANGSLLIGTVRSYFRQGTGEWWERTVAKVAYLHPYTKTAELNASTYDQERADEILFSMNYFAKKLLLKIEKRILTAKWVCQNQDIKLIGLQICTLLVLLNVLC